MRENEGRRSTDYNQGAVVIAICAASLISAIIGFFLGRGL
jgi:hypothetical protein